MPKAIDETWKLLDDFADAANTLAQLRDAELAADALCQLTTKMFEGDHASILTVRDGRATRVAATSSVPELADKIESATGQGPGTEATRREGTLRVDDLCTDPRWPAFGAQAVTELGVRSVLAHARHVDDHMLAVVTVYAAGPHAFGPQHETLVAIVGTAAVHAIATARHDEQVRHLEVALHTSRHIGVALGILMNSRRISLDDAWDVLRKASQDRNIKVSALAERIIATGTLDHQW